MKKLHNIIMSTVMADLLLGCATPVAQSAVNKIDPGGAAATAAGQSVGGSSLYRQFVYQCLAGIELSQS